MTDICAVELRTTLWHNPLAEAMALAGLARLTAQARVAEAGLVIVSIQPPPGVTNADEWGRTTAYRQILAACKPDITMVLFEIAAAPIVSTPAPVPAKHFPRGTNQDVINLFAAVFGNVIVNNAPAFIEALTRAGLANIANNRLSNYSGPPVEDMPNLTIKEKERLIGALMLPAT